MKKLHALYAAMIPGMLMAAEPQTGSGETDGYFLVWQDLFDSGELNRARWNVEVNNSGGGNNELQYYIDNPANVHVGDDGQGNGCLILTARREEYGNRHFTSGRVNSKNKIAFTHGKIEASIKLPKTADGLWPAFWMMGNDYDQVGWPKCGETDILEMGHSDGIRNGNQERFFNGACHWGQGWPNASYAKSTSKAYSLQDGEFHLFTAIWDDQKIRMYVDLDKQPKQNPYYELVYPQDDPENEWSAGNYFHKDNFILFNLAVGGNFPGIHDHLQITALGPEQGSEASMYINYVKIYQKNGIGENQSFAEPGDDISGVKFQYAEKENNIEFDGDYVYTQGEPLSLFTPAGQLAREASDGRIELSGLMPGIYIATTKTASRKIAIR